MTQTDAKQILLRLKPAPMRDVAFLAFALAVPLATLFAFAYPPTIASQGQAHRIFYIHVPIAWVALYAPLLSAVFGLMYIATRNERYDVWSEANAKIAFLFAIGVVITGALWAKTEWGVYWNWRDSRLMSFFVLCLTLGGYMIVRYMTEDQRKRPVYGAAMAILAAIASVLTWFAIRLITPDTHPTSVMSGMSPKIRLTFWLSVLAYHFLFLVFLRLSVRHEYITRILARARAEREG
jgi:heme exporter protein C